MWGTSFQVVADDRSSTTGLSNAVTAALASTQFSDEVGTAVGASVDMPSLALVQKTRKPTSQSASLPFSQPAPLHFESP